ncbi:MAG: redox-sensitive transcriptional activator SoxR [Homoserinimonas sp.]
MSKNPDEVAALPVRQIDPSEPLTIGDVMRRTGVSASALHFYERKGLISSARTSSNQRLYERHMLRRISLVLVAKRLGIPLADVARVFSRLPTDHAPTHQDWQRVSRAWKRQLEERRRQIESLERELTGCIGCGCLSMKACLLLNPDDSLHAQGPGPVRIQRQRPATHVDHVAQLDAHSQLDAHRLAQRHPLTQVEE